MEITNLRNYPDAFIKELVKILSNEENIQILEKELNFSSLTMEYHKLKITINSVSELRTLVQTLSSLNKKELELV